MHLHCYLYRSRLCVVMVGGVYYTTEMGTILQAGIICVSPCRANVVYSIQYTQNMMQNVMLYTVCMSCVQYILCTTCVRYIDRSVTLIQTLYIIGLGVSPPFKQNRSPSTQPWKGSCMDLARRMLLMRTIYPHHWRVNIMIQVLRAVSDMRSIILLCCAPQRNSMCMHLSTMRAAHCSSTVY